MYRHHLLHFLLSNGLYYLLRLLIILSRFLLFSAATTAATPTTKFGVASIGTAVSACTSQLDSLPRGAGLQRLCLRPQFRSLLFELARKQANG